MFLVTCQVGCSMLTRVSSTHYRIFDLVLAAVETVVTFNVAYGASTVLGTVLLQTSPARGLSGGRMEAFLRAMKEVMFLDLNPPLETKHYILGRTPSSNRPPTRSPHLATHSLPCIQIRISIADQQWTTPVPHRHHGITCPKRSGR